MTIQARLQSHGGLLANEGRKMRASVFITLLLVATSMTFMQLGFMGLGTSGRYIAYLLALFSPISVAALLLGWRDGMLTGLICGTILLVHTRIMPLDPIERYLISPLNSALLYAGAGLALGLFFGEIQRRKLTGIRKYAGIALACFAVSLLSTVLINLTFDVENTTFNQLKTYLYSGDSLIQVLGDTLLMSASCVVSDVITAYYLETKTYVTVRAIVRSNLIIALVVGYLMASSVGFTFGTFQEKAVARERMGRELAFIADQLNDRWSQYEYLSERKEAGKLTDEDLATLRNMVGMQEFVSGYDLSEGSIVITTADSILFSNNPVFEPGSPVNNHLDMEAVGRSARDNTMSMILYDEGTSHLQLGYLRAVEAMEGTYVTFSMPFSIVFDLRQRIMLWTSLITFVLLVMVYVMVARLLGKVVMAPINRTNRSLNRIVKGKLDELVSEVDSMEFATLSAGINATVDALKGWIDEAQRNIERELETARAIQEGALPRQYPAFPGVDCVDLYALMDAAKDVGGDFYDFFAIDDHTVCFLIADVSGKGIPGALFMMSAKTEIQNHLSSGAEPAQAIAAANTYLCEHNEAGMFVTVWAATLDWHTGLMTYVNAGHNFPLLRHGRSGSWEWLNQRTGLFLGTFETAKYRQKTLTLEPGDELMLYTDGVNETFSIDDEEYGNERLESFLCAHADERPNVIVPALRADVGAWAEGAEQSDDITILAVEYGV